MMKWKQLQTGTTKLHVTDSKFPFPPKVLALSQGEIRSWNPSKDSTENINSREDALTYKNPRS